MSSLNLNPAIAYRLKGTLQGVGIFMAAMTGLAITTELIAIVWGESGTIGGISLTSVAFAFVLGICIVREDLRLFIQHGIGRTTAFVAELVGIAVSSFVLAVAAAVLTAIMQLIAGSNGSASVSDIYQMIYLNDTYGQIMALPDQFMSVLFCFVVLCAAQAAGIFISMGYYHLNKIATIIVSIVVPLALVIGLPYVIEASVSAPASIAGAGFWTNFWINPWFALVLFLGTIVVFTLLNWLLIRRVAIRPAKA